MVDQHRAERRVAFRSLYSRYAVKAGQLVKKRSESQQLSTLRGPAYRGLPLFLSTPRQSNLECSLDSREVIMKCPRFILSQDFLDAFPTKVHPGSSDHLKIVEAQA
jgi:hypothetical protein